MLVTTLGEHSINRCKNYVIIAKRYLLRYFLLPYKTLVQLKKIKMTKYQQDFKSFDDILCDLGEFGHYQKRLFFLLFIPTIFSCMQNLSWVFLGADVPHRCLLPEEVGALHVSYQPREDLKSKLIISESDGSIDSCYYMQNNNMTYCNHGWVYDHSTIGSSAVMEWDLVCERKSFQATVQSLFMLGYLIGSYIIGGLSDLFGRRPVLLSSMLINSLCGIANGLATDYNTFIIFRQVINYKHLYTPKTMFEK